MDVFKSMFSPGIEMMNILYASDHPGKSCQGSAFSLSELKSVLVFQNMDDRLWGLL